MSDLLIKNKNRVIITMEQIHTHYEDELLPQQPEAGKITVLREKLRSAREKTKTQLCDAFDYAQEVADVKVSNSQSFGKKGNFSMLSGVAKSLVVFGIMIGLGITILASMRDNFDEEEGAYSGIDSVLDLFTDLTTWAGIVLLVIIGYIVLRYMGMFERE